LPPDFDISPFINLSTVQMPCNKTPPQRYITSKSSRVSKQSYFSDDKDDNYPSFASLILCYGDDYAHQMREMRSFWVFHKDHDEVIDLEHPKYVSMIFQAAA
jgi:hypothetical protein